MEKDNKGKDVADVDQDSVHVSDYAEADERFRDSIVEKLEVRPKQPREDLLRSLERITPLDYPLTWNYKVGILQELKRSRQAIQAAKLYEEELTRASHRLYTIHPVAEFLGRHHHDSGDFDKACHWWAIARDNSGKVEHLIKRYQKQLDISHKALIKRKGRSSSSKEGDGKIKCEAGGENPSSQMEGEKENMDDVDTRICDTARTLWEEKRLDDALIKLSDINVRDHPKSWRLKICINDDLGKEEVAQGLALEYETRACEAPVAYDDDTVILVAKILALYYENHGKTAQAKHWWSITAAGTVTEKEDALKGEADAEKVMDELSSEPEAHDTQHEAKGETTQSSKEGEVKSKRKSSKEDALKGDADVEKVMDERTSEPEAQDIQHEAKGKTTQSSKEGEVKSKRKSSKFEVLCRIARKRQTSSLSFIGSISTNVTTIKKSFLEAEESHISKFQRLVTLCSLHENLLTVEQGVRDENGVSLIMSEVVEPIEGYFSLEYEKLLKNSKEISMKSWWESIQENFWIVFRDVVRALMFLYSNDQVCGNIGFYTFITCDGRGRVIPSLKSTYNVTYICDDLKKLSRLIKSIITIPSQGSDLAFLPEGLKGFLDHIDRVDALIKSVPKVFLLDHPYFWSVGEKIDFSRKLRNLIKKQSVKALLEEKMDEMHLFTKWGERLNGAYLMVFDKYKTEPSVGEYKKRADIVRFIGAVYTHVNEHRMARKETLLGRGRHT